MITNTLKLYENRQDVTLTTYVLEDSPELLNGKHRPAILVCPGGGYLYCSDREAEPVALRFAAMGYHAFVLRYSVYSGGSPAPVPLGSDLPVNPNSLYPAPLRDIGKAFLTIRAHADEWLVDTDRIAICGFSAGGHNCAMYAVYWQDPVICEHFGEAATAFKPAAAILGYALTDYYLLFGETEDVYARDLTVAMNISYMGTKSPSEAMRDVASPALHVTENTPPTFLWATAGDALVPVAHTTRMAHALAQAGVPFEAHIFEEGQHGLSLADPATAGSLFEIDENAAKWVGLAEAWLEKRFALPILPKPAWMLAMEENDRN